MKGVCFVTSSMNERVAVQIDLKQLQRHQHKLEDFLDVIIAENRKDDEDISWADAKKELNKTTKTDFVNIVVESEPEIKKGKGVIVSSKEFDNL